MPHSSEPLSNRVPIARVQLCVAVAKIGTSTVVYSNQVTHLDDMLLDAHRCAWVRVDGLNRWGVYCKGSNLAVRLLPRSVAALELDAQGAVERDALVSALEAHLKALSGHKRRLGFTLDEAFRLCHGDSDGLPGIVIDDYQTFQVIQSGSAAGECLLDCVVAALRRMDDRPLLERSSGQIRRIENLPERTRWLVAPSEDPKGDRGDGGNRSDAPAADGLTDGRAVAKVSGLTLGFSPLRAQKTGLFLDQRENLRVFMSLARPSSGEPAHPWRSMLDVCCYVGAWSSAGARAGISEFALVDQDEAALSMASENVRANLPIAAHRGTPADSGCAPGARIETHHGDLFELLSKIGKSGRRFDVVVGDPPAFAKSKKHVPEARRAYARLAKLASRLVAPGGLYVACSCSRNVDEAEFLDTVTGALEGDDWVLVSRGAQSPDHTVPAVDALSHYLKCFFFLKRGFADA